MDRSIKGAPRKYQIELLAGLLITLLLLLVYGQIRSFNFVRFDDDLYVTANRTVQAGITIEGVKWAFENQGQNYWQPLAWLSHMLDCEIYGINAGKHHTTSLILHILNSLALFVILRGMTGTIWRSALVSILFAIHPLNVESVAWISERKTVLATFFGFLAIGSYLIYCHRPRLEFYFATFVFFCLSLMSKPMLVTLPFALLLLDFWPLNRLRISADSPLAIPADDLGQTIGARRMIFPQFPLTNILIEKIPLLLLAGLAIAVSTVAINQLELRVAFGTVPLIHRIANALVAYKVYLSQVFWPAGLAFFYPYPTTIAFWEPLSAAVILLSVSFLAFWWSKKAPYFIVGWLWFLGTLVPMIGIVQAGLWPAHADRFVYVPAIGLFLAVSWGVTPIAVCRPRRWRFLASGFVGLVLISLALTAYRQVATWRNSIALFKNALAYTSNNFLAHNNLGNVYLSLNRIKEAQDQYQQAIKANPRYSEAQNNYAALLLKQGQFEKAVGHFRIATEINPHNPGYRSNLDQAISLVHLQRAIEAFNADADDTALQQIDNALQINHRLAQALLLKAKVYERRQNYSDAIEVYIAYLEFAPRDASVCYQIARLYSGNRNSQMAAQWMDRAIANGFDDWETFRREKLFQPLFESEPFQELVRRYPAALGG